MSNKIINIGAKKSNISSNEVYKDISMTGNIIRKIKYENRYNNVFKINDNTSDNNLLTDENMNILESNTKHKTYTELYDKNAASSTAIIEYSIQINKLVNVKAIQNSLHNIFSWLPGERILNPEFGSRLYEFLYNGITQFSIEQIIVEIQKCVSQWEPRINIVNIINVSTPNNTENNTIQLDIIYTIPSLDINQYKYSYIYNKKMYNI